MTDTNQHQPDIQTQAKGWLKALTRFEGEAIITEETEEDLHVRIETSDCYYNLTFVWPTTQQPEGYIGGSANRYKDQSRDTGDGPCTLETWNDILCAIVGFEMAVPDWDDDDDNVPEPQDPQGPPGHCRPIPHRQANPLNLSELKLGTQEREPALA